ncbi:ATPase associated with various cellular activities family protein [Mycobacterium xenopi 3993]|nr:ATPase associated with various cellular activities family protein [Mycobacterium xenopi 3993]
MDRPGRQRLPGPSGPRHPRRTRRRRPAATGWPPRCTPSSGPSSRSSGSSSARTSSSSGCWSGCCPRARAARRCARGGQDPGGGDLRPGGRRDLRPHPVHARPGAHRHHRYPHLPAGQGGVRHRAGPGGGQLPARRRNQPGPAKVQSALLEVMQERHVSIGGKTFPMPNPFLVMATQNPIEHEGVYPLPEAQRDRFLFKINVGYPSPEEEREIIYRMGVTPPTPKQVLQTGDLLRLQDIAANNFVHHALVDYVVRVVTATRHPEQLGMNDVKSWVAFGASPRASLGIIAAARSLALVRGRDYVIPRTSSKSFPTCCGTGWCSPTTRSPTRSHRRSSSTGSCRRLPCRR